MAKEINKSPGSNRKKQLDFTAVFIALFVVLYVSFVLCILADTFFGWSMYKAWLPLVPGFIWPVTLEGFLVGSVWMLSYSVYFAALFVYPFNYIVGKRN